MAESNNSEVVNNENSATFIKSGQNSESEGKGTTDNVLRPILLEEYKYEESPESLQNLMTFIESGTTSQSRIDILVGLIFLLMVESGFVPSDYSSAESTFDFHYKRVMKLSRNPPLNLFLSNRSYYMKIILSGLQQFEVKLAVVCVSDDVVVNCFVKGLEYEYFNVLLDPLTYFTSSNVNIKTVKFQHLDNLSCLIKNKIAFPAKYSILKQNGIAFPCFEDLPPEVILLIMKKLPLVDLVQFGKISHKYCVLTQDLLKKFGKKMQ